jgi:hypothetical protein
MILVGIHGNEQMTRGNSTIFRKRMDDKTKKIESSISMSVDIK